MLCCCCRLSLSMKTRWLAFAVARSQLVASTRYNDERCVSVQLQVGVLEGRCRCRCDVVFQVTIARSENTPSSAPPCSGRLHAHVERARGGGRFVSGLAAASLRLAKTLGKQQRRSKRSKKTHFSSRLIVLQVVLQKVALRKPQKSTLTQLHTAGVGVAYPGKTPANGIPAVVNSAAKRLPTFR